jgi:broad specificity phosphatase PhoE
LGRSVLGLIRHGEYAQPAGVPSAHLPYALTPAGLTQAREAALAVLDFARSSQLELQPVIDCSRLRRSWETANVMARTLQQHTEQGFACRELDELAERGLGALANLTVEAIETIVRDDPRYPAPPPGWKRDSAYRLPYLGCESLADAGARVARHLRSCAAELSVPPSRLHARTSGLKLLVGHGGAFRHAAGELGLLSPDQVANLSMDYGAPIYFELERLANGSERFIHIAGSWRQRRASGAID